MRMQRFAKLAAASLGVVIFAPAARADFGLAAVPLVTSGGDSSYEVFVTSNSANNTGSNMYGFNITLDTNGPGNYFVFDLQDDVDGDGITPDANIVGAVDQQGNFLSPSYSATGQQDSILGTFIGPPPTTTNSYLFRASAYNTPNAWINQNTATRDGSGSSYLPVPGGEAIWESSLNVNGGAIDPSFVKQIVNSLEIAYSSGAPETTTNTATNVPFAGLPIANIVLPTGAPFTVTGQIAYTPFGSKQLLTPLVDATPAQAEVFGSHDGAQVDSPLLGSTATSNGLAMFSTGLPAAAGSIQYSGFGQGASVGLLLKFTNGVSDPFSTEGDQILAFLQAADPADVITSTIPANVAAMLPGYDVMVSFTAAMNDPFVNFNFSSFGGGTLELAGVGFVPEPLGVGTIVLGSMFLLGRKRRRELK